MIAAILLGFGMGFVAAIPVAGPVSAMVIERTLDKRYAAALAVAFGSALAEGFYAALAVLGVSLLADYPWMEPASKAVAAAILIGVGLSFALRKKQEHDDDEGGEDDGAGGKRKDKKQKKTPLGQFAIGFSVTIVNPTLLATWTAATSMVVAAGVELRPILGAPFGLAVALGVSSWFSLVVYLVRRFTKSFKPSSIRRVIGWIGWGLVGLGLYFAFLFVKELAA
ncbi:MAG: LysE family transporter [Myxococcales bacterium]|nr:LysE family transporter [Myxococcales bacterium]MCB9731263.1 LysE family transporter [Deltaproteobacteria bacterium]